MKVILTVEDIRKKFNLPEDIDIVIENQKDSSNAAPEWIDVPKNWGKACCPTFISNEIKIEVKLRSGNFEVGRPCDWEDCWMQEGYWSDIIAYRVLE